MAGNYDCYAINGKKAPYDALTYAPCNQTAVSEGRHSPCCAIGDKCLTNGLCKRPDDDDLNWYWRFGCTDPTWKDPACPNYCNIEPKDNELIFQCPQPKKWCCLLGTFKILQHATNVTCCGNDSLTTDAGDAVVFGKAELYFNQTTLSTVNPTTVSIQSTTASSSSVATTLATTTNTPITSATNAAQDSNSRNLGIGLGVGIAALALAAACVGFLIWRFARKQKDKKQSRSALLTNDMMTPLPEYSTANVHAFVDPIEMHSHDVVEIAAGRERAELEAK